MMIVSEKLFLDRNDDGQLEAFKWTRMMVVSTLEAFTGLE